MIVFNGKRLKSFKKNQNKLIKMKKKIKIEFMVDDN
jgi:hypothetical protein